MGAGCSSPLTPRQGSQAGFVFDLLVGSPGRARAARQASQESLAEKVPPPTPPLPARLSGRGAVRLRC